MTNNRMPNTAGTGTPAHTAPRCILRIDGVKATTGAKSHTSIYNHIKAGLFPQAIPLGMRSVGWPSDEVEAVIAARVAGADDAALRALVAQLHAARQTKYEALLGRVLGTGDTHAPAPAKKRTAGHLAVVEGVAA